MSVTMPAPLAAAPLTIAIVLLWPIAVVLYTWLAVVLLRPGRTRRRGRLPAPPRERTPGSTIEPS